MVLPVVAIVGRPNVGKSTLFNRIAGERIAIVEDKPGITRDRIYAQGEWTGKRFHLIDTGGIEFGGEDVFIDHVRHQVELAVDEADMIVFVVDGREGLMPSDEEVATWLHRSGKPVVVAVNKADNRRLREDMYEFYSLGFDEVIPISALHGTGTGDLLEPGCPAFPIGRKKCMTKTRSGWPSSVARMRESRR